MIKILRLYHCFVFSVCACVSVFSFFAVGVFSHVAIRSKIAAPSFAGDRTTVTSAASKALILSSAVPLPPDMIAPEEEVMEN